MFLLCSCTRDFTWQNKCSQLDWRGLGSSEKRRCPLSCSFRGQHAVIAMAKLPRRTRKRAMTSLYRDGDAARQVEVKKKPGDGRNAYRRDWARLIHSASFRRLQGKTQLFPSDENDFYRNRLTHSLEVAQIASGIAENFNAKKNSFFNKDPISVDLIYFAGLAHDLGHPPFGHNGEKALDRLMARYGGFEGNAQTLRILARLEKKETASFPRTNEPRPITDNEDNRYGLNVTYRSLASVLKYDNPIPQIVEDRKDDERNKPVKGYYFTETELVRDIKQHVLGEQIEDFKTVECGIMDIADDLAYSTYDLEDSFKDEWTSPIKILALSEESKRKIIGAVNSKLKSTYRRASEGHELNQAGFNDIIVSTFENVFTPSPAATARYMDRSLSRKMLSEVSVIAVGTAEASSASLCHNGYLRGEFTSKLVNEFMNAVQIKIDKNRPQLSKVFLDIETFKKVE